MKFFKKQLVLIFFVGFVYFLYFLFHLPIAPQTQQHVLGAANNLVLLEQPMSGRQPLLTVLQNAQHEILIEVYLLSDKEIISALTQAKARGVDVKVMLEEHPFGGGNSNQKTQQLLQQAGIAVLWTNPAFALTHEKAVIVDRQEVFILNQNLTTSSFEKNREFDIIDSNPQDVQEAGGIFLDDWQRTSFTPTKGSLLMSPNTARTALTDLVTSATQTIAIEMEVITDNEIVQLLQEKAKTVHIEIIEPTEKQVAANTSPTHLLEQAGVVVKTISSPYIHAKLIIVDGKKAYIGSVNFTSQSMDQNRELGILVSQQNILTTLVQDFNQDFQQATLFP